MAAPLEELGLAALRYFKAREALFVARPSKRKGQIASDFDEAKDALKAAALAFGKSQEAPSA